MPLSAISLETIFLCTQVSCFGCRGQLEKREKNRKQSVPVEASLYLKACLLSDQKKTAKYILRKIPEQTKHFVSSSFSSDLLGLEIINCLCRTFKFLPAIVNK